MFDDTYDLQFNFSINNIAFKVIEFEVEEGLSSLFTIQLLLASTNSRITEDEIVDQLGTLTVIRNNLFAPERYFHGVAFRFSKGDTGHHYTYYRITLVPEFARLSLRENSRIFQGKNVIEITETLLGEMGLTDYQLAIRHKKVHTPREFCVQYCESDLAFIERLLAEEGIFYYFEHTKETDMLIFADDNSVLTDLGDDLTEDKGREDSGAGILEYNNMSGASTNRPYIRSFEKRAEVSTGKVTLKDYSFLRPSYSFLMPTPAKDKAYANDKYEHYMYPGRFKNDDVGEWFSETRVNYLRRDAQTAKGISNISSITPGFLIRIMGHIEVKSSDVWAVTHVKHKGTQPQALRLEGREGMTTYNNTFYAIPKSNQWKPKPEPKPRIYGPQIGTVVGPEGEEIYTDEFGRVKVQFPWDRDGESNEKSSCWIRVAQVGAGSTYGNIVIPRTGHEVIVSFLEGDPDQPVVTGATFHATNPPPINLPADKTKMSFRGKTHDGSHGADSSSFNELSFENDKNRQLFYMQAEKDMKTWVKNDRHTHVEANHTEYVDQNQTITIGQDQDSFIVGNQKNIIEKDQTNIITENQETHVEKNRDIIVNGSLTETVKFLHRKEAENIVGIAKETQVFQANKMIEIKCGEASIVLDGETGNIYINGVEVLIN